VAGLIPLLGTTRRACALAQESVGNKPLHEANYRDWAGIMPVINHKSRVYHIWVNGNERFYYRGDTRAANVALKLFAAAAAERHEVILRPGPAETKTFQDVRIPYDWDLHLEGGIVRAHHERHPSGIWDKHPTITIYVGGGNVDVEKLRIPAGVSVVQVTDLRARYRKGLESDDKTVRGHAAHRLAEVDAGNASNAAPIAKLLEDEDDWVRLMAAGALAKFGRAAVPTLPTLRGGLQDDSERIRKKYRETIDSIEGAEDDPAAAKQRQEMLAKIGTFCTGLSEQHKNQNASRPVPTQK